MMAYHPVAKLLHWLMAIMLLAIFLFGLRLEDLTLAERMEHLPVHASLGLSLLALVLIRLVWRWQHPPPPYSDSMSPGQQKWARGAVHAFYALMTLQPVLGFLHAATYVDFEIIAFGVLNITALLPSDATPTGIIHIMHGLCAWFLALLVIGHVGATIKHMAIDKDGIAARMIPFLKVSKAPK